MKTKRSLDVAFIGGGIAGMAAAVCAARDDKSCIMLERGITGEPADFATMHMRGNHAYCTEQVRKARDDMVRYGVIAEEIHSVINLDLNAQPKIIETEDTMYEAETVIMANGRVPVSWQPAF